MLSARTYVNYEQKFELIGNSNSDGHECSSVCADSRIRGKSWGFGLALERILVWWQAAAVSGVHKVSGVHRGTPGIE
jgi:hypothetical protein